ncbi:MAG: MBL fold metallo-hydrolase, partial [Planctomycetota bacterium]
AVEKLNHIFITHLHSDHTAGYSDFLLTPWVLERKENVEAFGPPGLQSMTEHILKAYEQDIQVRIFGPEHALPAGITVNVHEFEPGKIFEDENVRVSAFPVRHGAWKHAYGFRFETPDRVIVISGDTVPCQALVDQAMGCDLLIHEVYSKTALERRPSEWQQYHKASHTSTEELAEIANKVKPRLLVLYHQLYWGTSDSELLEEIGRNYDGEVVSGKDLDVY